MPRSLVRVLTGEADGASDLKAKETREIELRAMQAVMKIEKQPGCTPKDVSAARCGYGIESHIPEELRTEATSSFRFIEVKGRAKGADSAIVTKNEILTALNRPEQYLPAIVEADGEHTSMTYLRRPFRNAPDFASRSVLYDMLDLTSHAEVVFAGH